jgi:hypothetical protein
MNEGSLTAALKAGVLQVLGSLTAPVERNSPALDQVILQGNHQRSQRLATHKQ